MRDKNSHLLRIEIKCHDCNEPSIATVKKSVGGYYLPTDWIHVQIKLKDLYLCPDCKEKRKQFGHKLI